MQTTARLDQLLKAITAATVTGSRSRDVTGVVCDSRQVRTGSVYVAVKGESLDGARFIDDALDRGAVAVVGEGDVVPKKEACYIRVPDARQALAELACAFHQWPSAHLRMFGVTGTNGKTTTAYLLRHILNRAGLTTGLVSTVEYAVGERSIPASRTTPEAPVLQSLLAQMRTAGCQCVAMEVSSHALVQRRTLGIDYDCAIFTNLTRDHLDYHETREKYFAAKLLLFSGLGRGRKSAVAVVNLDDPQGREVARQASHVRVVTYAVEAEADVRAVDVQFGEAGTVFRLVSPWGEVPVSSRLMGRFNVSNALASISACAACGVDLPHAAAAVADMDPVPGRLQQVPTGRGFHVFVDYAHTDDALENVLRTLREITRRRLIVVFGCGGNRDKTKRPAMGTVAARLADHVIITSDNPRKEDPMGIIHDILGGVPAGTAHDVLVDRHEAIRRAIDLARDGDVVLVAGKGHETFQEFANTTLPFDDRQVVRECLS